MRYATDVALCLALAGCVSSYTVPGLEARRDTIDKLEAGARKLGCSTQQKLERGEQAHDVKAQWVYNTLFVNCDGQGATFRQTKKAFSETAEVYVSNCEAPCRKLVDDVVRAAGLGADAIAAVKAPPAKAPPAKAPPAKAPPAKAPETAKGSPTSLPATTAGATAEPAAPPASSPPPAPAPGPRTGSCKFTSGDFVRDEVTQGKGTRYFVGIEQGRVARVHFEDGATDMPIVGPAQQSDDEALPVLSDGQPASVMLFDEHMQAYPSVQLVLRGSVIEGTHPWPAANKTRYTLTCVWD